MSKMTKKNQDALVEVITDLTYLPSVEQRRAKESFWARFSDNPFCSPEEISLSDVQRVLGDSRVDRWWREDGFSAWFRNREEFRERVEYLVHLALDTIEKVMIDPEEKGAAKVNAAKLMMEVGRKMPPKSVREVYKDDKINKMDAADLEEYIKRNSPKLIEGDNKE